MGFRYHAQYAAQSYGVTGWVQNLYDGSVEMEAEGTEEAIDQMLLVLDRDRYISIEEMKVKAIPVCGDRYFDIR